ncbi:MAG TPA: SUMF1/EgtB/PvdO family nonheme iron enzyme [Accumulibacter sp.]|nr:SUMF1/EgtB/PvdO family nonheme iron enzyme [Accumulibacter sp.]
MSQPSPAVDPPSAAPVDFFISYNQTDRAWAEWIAWQLEASGYRTLSQAWDFQAGGNFVLAMQDAAQRSRRTLAVLSKDFLAAKFTQPEWAAAFARDPTGAERRLLPVRIADCQPDGLLAPIVYIDLVGLAEEQARERLLAQVGAAVGNLRSKPTIPSPFPGAPAAAGAAPGEFPGLPAALRDFRAACLASADAAPPLDEASLPSILRHCSRTLDEYRLARIAEWSQKRYALDQRCTRLTLLLDQGPDAHAGRWQAQTKTFDDLRAVLAESGEPALVVLGPPGCGKSTLLRRLELDLAADALRAPHAQAAQTSFFISLSRYRQPGNAPLPEPLDWLSSEWQRQQPQLPDLATLLAGGRLRLLLDALNEMPHRDADDYRQRIERWSDCVADLAHRYPGTRVVFSCRSLDYSASLSTPGLPVPHVRVEALTDVQVEQFLSLHDAARGARLWQQLRGTPQLELFRSPYYLKLLLAQADAAGELPRGRAALFTGFVRQTLAREIEARNPLFAPDGLLARRDGEQIVRHEWRNAVDLPQRGPLLPALARLAHALQARRAPGQSARVRTAYDDALALLAHARGEDLLRAGVALQVLETQWDEVYFVHQLLQEYFAARALVAQPQPALAALAATEWRAAAMQPSFAEVIAGLAPADPLPAAPATGWEETFLLAAELLAHAPGEADVFIRALRAHNLPLAGRCAAQPEVNAALSPALHVELQQALVARSRDPAADLRARIAAGHALSELGDPRFTRQHGPYGDYLLPPRVTIPAGSYPIDSDEGIDPGEAPARSVELGAFAIASFPVTNAEWRLFMASGGYDDERWWEGDAAERWRRGETTAEGVKQGWRDALAWIRANPAAYGQMGADGRVSATDAAHWQALLPLSADELEAAMATRIPGGPQREPALWHDPAFNGAAQPVVGICWYEARAYCAWLSAQSRQRWRLSSEAEWEAAARGVGGRSYPWGDEFDAACCNMHTTHVRATTPVGVFPMGDTSNGLADMSGNVWEWTSSAYQTYPYVVDDGREDHAADECKRVLRGGAWGDHPDVARAVRRNGGHPGYRSDYWGFRLVSPAPIS